jgi:hypothetical protein
VPELVVADFAHSDAPALLAAVYLWVLCCHLRNIGQRGYYLYLAVIDRPCIHSRKLAAKSQSVEVSIVE